MKLAEALIYRKQLENKVKQLEPIKQIGEQGLLELKTQRMKVNETLDEIKIQYPKVTLADVTAEYDFYATQLRKLDTAIQQANWKHDIEFTEQDAPSQKKKEKK